MNEPTSSSSDSAGANFIRAIMQDDLRTGKWGGRVVTRFPPEPNGYLHIGHAKSICTNFGLAAEFGGVCHLRFDDTNPSREDQEFVDAIEHDVRWLGFDWKGKKFHASDYFGQLYDWAEKLIRKGKAYVCFQTEEQMREARGTVTEPGRPSPWRDSSPEENLALFRRMRAGEFPDGHCVLRAKIDMAHPNMKMRDWPMYRIRHVPHQNTGDAWCIYPLYDYAHCTSDSIEGITHSICTLEFENNRELYDWFLANIGDIHQPQQIEFARLGLNYTVMSKRKLRLLVEEGHVRGWDDPRMPTLAGLRRRGVTPEAIRALAERVGVAKANSTVDIQLFEGCIRDDLSARSPRVLAVARPLKVVLTDWPEGRVEWLDAPYWPQDTTLEKGQKASRDLPFGRELYIDQDDFALNPPPGFHRLAPGREVRLRHGYIIRCDEVITDAAGEPVELRCSHDPSTRGGNPTDGRKVKGTIHWVSAAHAVPVELRLYNRLFAHEDPEAQGSFLDCINPLSLELVRGFVEPSLAQDPADTRYQFERLGYFWRDPVDSRPEALVFNRVVPLKDSWARQAPAQAAAPKAEAKAPSGAPAKAPEAAREDSAEVQALLAQGVSANEARALAADPEALAYFHAALAIHPNARSLAPWVSSELPRELKGRPLSALPPASLAQLVALLDEGAISGKIGKTVLGLALETGEAPRVLVETRGLRQISDPETLRPLVEQVLARHPDQLAQARGGNARMVGFLVGQLLAASGGKANPKLANELVEAAVRG